MTNFQNADWQNFIYLSLVLLVLAGSIFSRRDLPWRKILQYLGIWTLVALIGISLYAYRFEFSDFKNRILGEINPSLAQTNQQGQLRIIIFTLIWKLTVERFCSWLILVLATW